MNKIKIVNIVVIVICVLIAVVYFIGNYKTYVSLEKTYETKSSELNDLKKEYSKLEEKYEAKVEDSYKISNNVSAQRVSSDIKFLEKYLKTTLTFETADEYNKNRANLLKVTNPNSNYFSDFLVENKNVDGVATIEASGLKMECVQFDVYPSISDFDNSDYVYYIIAGYLPYFNDDNKNASAMNKQRLVMKVQMNTSGKKIDILECYKSDIYMD